MNTARTLHEDRIRVLKATATLQRLSASHQLARLKQTPALYLTALSLGLIRRNVVNAWLLKLLPRHYSLLAAGWPILQRLLSLSRNIHERRQDASAAQSGRTLGQ